MDEFLQTLSSRVQAIEHAAALQRFEEVQQAAHLLQGAAANVGALRLAAACQAVESSSRRQMVVSAELAWLAACEQGTRRAFKAS
jgi:HPt (histidine-containing phosphotransfer) domain-containing protein